MGEGSEVEGEIYGIRGCDNFQYHKQHQSNLNNNLSLKQKSMTS
jgi:hypothetical protein